MDNITELLASLLKSIELEEEKIKLQHSMVYSLYKKHNVRFTEEQKKLIYKLIVVPKFGSMQDWLEVLIDNKIKAKQMIWNKPEREVIKQLEKMYGDKGNGQN